MWGAFWQALGGVLNVEKTWGEVLRVYRWFGVDAGFKVL